MYDLFDIIVIIKHGIAVYQVHDITDTATIKTSPVRTLSGVGHCLQ